MGTCHYFPCHHYGSEQYGSFWTVISHVTSCFAFQAPCLPLGFSLQGRSCSYSTLWSTRSNSEPSEVTNTMEKCLFWRSLAQREEKKMCCTFRQWQQYCKPILSELPQSVLWHNVLVLPVLVLKVPWLLININLVSSWCVPAGGSRPLGSNLPCTLRNKEAFYRCWSMELHRKATFIITGSTELCWSAWSSNMALSS